MKKISKIIATILFLYSNVGNAQVGIATTTPDPSSILDVVSSTQGFLQPRMTTSQRIGIPTPAAGLQVYDTTTNTNWYFNGTVWIQSATTASVTASNGLTATSGDVKLGGVLTQPTTISGLTATNKINILGTGIDAFNVGNNALSIDATNGRVGIGITTPSTNLDVNGQIKISGGSPAAGKVLVSDAVGLATWIAPTAIGAGDNLGNHTATTTVDLNNNYIANGRFVVQNAVDGGSSRGIFMWTPTDTNWGIYMAQPGVGRSLSNGNAVAGAGFNTHSLRFRTSNSVFQGVIFENRLEELNMSIRGNDGLIYMRGDVGIGTLTPAAKLHINNSTQIANTVGASQDIVTIQTNVGNNSFLKTQQRRHTTGSDWNGTNVRMQRAVDATNMGFIDYGIDGNTGDLGLGFGSNNTTNMVLTSTGNLGIGTSTPSNKLDINGTARIRSTAAGTATDDVLTVDPTGVIRKITRTSINNSADLRLIGSGNHITSDAGISSNGSSVGSGTNNIAMGLNSLNLNNSGFSNIAVGTESLHSNLNGSYNVATGVNSLYDVTTGSYNIAVGSFSGVGLTTGNNNTILGSFVSVPPNMTNNIIIADGDGNQRINVITNGFVGVNTNVPTFQLSVNGTAGKTGGGAWAAFSDIRVKKNILDYSKGLSEILKIRPVTFEYNGKAANKADGKVYVGVIAQEIEKILPTTVTKIKTEEFDDLRQYDSSELIYTLINAVKELKKEIDVLKEQISKN
ncbi:tail fiber domain-containing protein [Flavobacterium sp.]|uniref:tail fiber domain-containing protein n=1 Tax=Flavobacterium sp. TaxID=239 RepID=UPI0037513F80